MSGKVGTLIIGGVVNGGDADGAGGEVSVDMDGAFQEVKGDDVAIADLADGATDSGFGGAMNTDTSVRDARNAGVGDEGDFAIEHRGAERSGGDEDFGHATADRAEAAQHDDVTGLDLARGRGV